MAHRKSYEEILADYDPDIQIKANALKKSIGAVTSPGQIAKAVYYLDHIGHGKEELKKDHAFGAVVNQQRTRLDFDRVWREISICRTIGEPTANFVAIGRGPEDQFLVDEFHVLVQHWGLLTGYELLGGLEEWEEIKAAKDRGELMAGQLRAFLNTYRRKVGFGLWTLEHMNGARHKLATVWYNFRGGMGGYPKVSPVKELAIRAIPRESAVLRPQILDSEDVNMADSTPGSSQEGGIFKLGRFGNRPNKRLRLLEPSLPDSPISTGADSRPKSPKRSALQVEIHDLGAASETTAELTRLLALADAAKAKALQVRRGDNGFEKLSAILGKWKQGDHIHMESLKDVYVSDVYAMHQLAKEQEEAKASIEAADNEAAAAEEKYKDAMAKFEREMGVGV